MVIRRAGLESLFPRGGRRGRTQKGPGWPTDINQFDFPGQALVAPPGIGLQQPTVVRPMERRIRPLPIGEPIPFDPPPPSSKPPPNIRDMQEIIEAGLRPPIEEPGGPRPPRRPPGESVMAKVRALRAQIQQLNAQIQSLLGGRKRWMDDLDFGPGGEPPMPVRPPTILPRPFPRPPIGPPSIGPISPPSMPVPSPGTPPPPRPIPPWGG